MIIGHFKNLLKQRYKKRVVKKARSFKEPLKVNGPSNINNNTYLGKNVNFNGMIVLGKGKVIIGDNFHSGQNCYIITDNHNYEGTRIPYDESFIIKEVTIKDNVWLGHGVIILGGVTIGEGAIIQAGSVVVRSIPDLAIAGGHPAKPFKYRNKAHYFELKRNELFI